MHSLSKTSKVILGVSLTLGLGAVSAAEPVGTLSRVEGFAFVSQGAQYVAGREGMSLKEGDRVMVMDGGNAIISFADGCKYSLADNEVLSLGGTSTCASDSDGSYKIDPYVAAPQTPAKTVDSVRFAQAQVGGSAPAPWVVPTIAGLSITGLVIAGATADSDNNVSDRIRAIVRDTPSP